MSLLRRKTLTILLAVLAVWFGQKALGLQDRRTEIARQAEDLKSRVADLERNNQFLASSSEYFGSDAYLERQARLKLNYKLPDEQVAFVYKDTSEKKLAPAEEFKASLAAMPNWKKWWYYILGH